MNRAPCTAGHAPPLHGSQPIHGRSDGIHPRYPQNLLIRGMEALLAWQDRARERRKLGQLDERLLRDIGVDRATADTEALKPFWRG